jgi:8-hydroxy-5-deazaflavin:NADPH oxidoreductase
MNIAIIGSGRIGAGLARAWAARGHSITFGARTPDDAELVELSRGLKANVASIAEAPRSAEVVVFAMPFTALDAVLQATGDLAGKVVIDCTNAVEKGSLKYAGSSSAAEELQKKLPSAHVFKSFNAQGAENLANPSYDGVAATNFFCGDDAAGRLVVKQLVEDIGFEAMDAGPLKNARLIEPLMLLWVASSKALGTRDVAFKVLRR